MFTTIHFLLNVLLFIFFYIILLFILYSLPKKQVLSLSLSLSLTNYFLQLYFRLMNFFCPYFWMIHFGSVFFELFITCTLYPSYSFGLSQFLEFFRSENLSLYQNIIYMIVYLNYLSNTNRKFVMRFVYHNNFLKRMRNSNNQFWNLKILVVEKINHYTLYKNLNNTNYLKKNSISIFYYEKNNVIISIKCT